MCVSQSSTKGKNYVHKDVESELSKIYLHDCLFNILSISQATNFQSLLKRDM